MRGVLLAALLASSLFLLELGLRAIFAYEVGPSILLYGLSREGDTRHFDRSFKPPPATNKQSIRLNKMFRDRHGDEVAWAADEQRVGYKKYGANQIRVDRDQETGVRFEVAINRHGFRGPDFEPTKPPDTLRIVTLGASSTFGYFNRDETTYPRLLEAELNARCHEPRTFEVINLGIPHLKAEEIHALFLAEALPLSPDVVTLYAGRNDSLDTLSKEETPSTTRDIVEVLRKRLITAAFLDSLLDLRALRVSRVDVERGAAGASRRFGEHLAAIRDECERRGILFVALSQQAASMSIPRDRLKGVSYAAEVERVQRALDRGERPLRQHAITFLGHDRIMRDLIVWVEAEDVPYIDVRSALDEDRDVLLSWVHLGPRGNRMVAEALADDLLARTCDAPIEKGAGR
jgi:hypothetical protein